MFIFIIHTFVTVCCGKKEQRVLNLLPIDFKSCFFIMLFLMNVAENPQKFISRKEHLLIRVKNSAAYLLNMLVLKRR